MKILIVSEFFPRNSDLQFSGGVEIRNYFVAKYLSKKHEIKILTKRLKGSKEREIINGIDVVRVGQPTDYQATTGGVFGRIKFIASCLKKAKEIDADIVEGTNFITHFIARRIASDKKITAIAWYPDVWLSSWIKNAGPVGAFGELLEKLNLNSDFENYITISRQTAIKLEKYTKKPITIIPCGVDLKEFKHKTEKQSGKIICISRLVKYKNVKDLIFAFALLQKRLPYISLTVIGEGPENKNLESLIKNIQVSKVRFLKNLKRVDLIKELQTSEVFCLPSKVEGFGIAIIEAAAAGIPYVVSDIPVFKEVTQNFYGGSSFEVGNINQLSKNLGLLLTNRKIYNQKVKQCVEMASNYSWGRVAQETEKVYKKPLQQWPK